MNESYTMEEIDLGLLTELVIEELQEQSDQKKIKITLQKDSEIYMKGDQTLLLRMMINLIQNAINYGKEDGHIDIILKEDENMIQGEVKDDGIGISEEHISKIWDRFNP